MGVAKEIKFNIDMLRFNFIYPSLKFYFPLFQTHHLSISNPKAKDYRMNFSLQIHTSLLAACQ